MRRTKAMLTGLRNSISAFLGVGSGARRRCRCGVRTVEFLEPRQLLSAISVKSLVNGIVTTSETRPNLATGSSLNRTYEVRNSGTEPLQISSLSDDGGNGFQTTAFADHRFIPSPDRRDIVHDAKRGLLYISTDDGKVQQYDLIQDKFLSPFTVGGHPFIMDLSPNQNRLIVSNVGGPWLSLIDLKTGSVSRVNVSGGDSNVASVSAVFQDDETYAYTISSYSPILGNAIPLSTSLFGAVLSISADRSTIGYVETGISSGGTGRFNTVDGTSGTSTTSWFNWDVAVSRNGRQLAVPTYGGTYIYDAAMQLQERIGIYADEGPIGVAYSPTSDIVYFAWADWKYQHAAIDAWDTNTFTRVSVIDPTWRYGFTGNGTLVSGRLKISRDGEVLFATAPDGVRVYGTDDLSPVLTSGDADGDGLIDPGEVWTYQARDAVQRGMQQNAVIVHARTTGGVAATSTTDSWYRGVDFNLDYGDAPDPMYPTHVASNGASHGIVTGLFLGATIDQDLDAQPGPLADNDDQSGRDDDDGVEFANPLVPGTSTTIAVRVASNGSAWLNAWLDFNGDGDWDDAGEKFAASQPVSPGVHFVPINIPDWVTPGFTFARFRLSTTAALDVTGPASDGEVEDYRIPIRPVAPVLQNSPAVVNTEPSFSWSRVRSATAYEVQISTRGTRPAATSRTVVDSTNFNVQTPLGFGRYAIWVRALNGDHNPSGWSVIREFQVDAAPGLTLASGSTFDRRPEITWSSVPGAVNYEVYLQTEKAGVRSVYAIVPGVTQTKFTPYHDLPAGLYRIWVRAVNSSQFRSSWSEAPAELFVGGETRITPPGDVVSPSTPLTWMPVAGAVRYELWVDQIDAPRQLLHTNQISSTSFVPEFALPRGRFKAWVRAISGEGATAVWSQPVTFEIVEQHAFLTGINPTFDATPTWTWDAVPGASSYDVLVQRKSAGTFATYRQQAGIATNSYTPPLELPNGDYRIHFRPVTGGSRGQWQSPAAEIHIGGQTQFLALDKTYPEAPGFSWQSVDGAVTYELWINQIGGTVRIIHRTDLTSPQFAPEVAMPKGQYAAWVRAIGPGEQPGPWSLPQSFRVSIERPFVSGNLPTFNRRPTWSWTGIPISESYDLKIERQGASDFEELAVHRGLTFLQFTPTADLPDGNYRVSYRRVDAAGTTGPWQFPAAQFHVGGKTSIRQVLVSETQSVTIRWRPVDGAARSEIWISQVGGASTLSTATSDAKSEYKLATPLPVGHYRVWIRSISTSGITSPWSEPASFHVA